MDTKKLRQKILDLAIHGKLVPQDPNDEPASVLLERIRAEKERLVKEGKIKKSKATKTSDTPHYENLQVGEANVPFEVPSSWEWTTVASFTYDLQYGTSEKSSNKGSVPVLRMGNITRDGSIDYSDLVYSSNEEDIRKFNLQKNDLLFNRTNSSEWVGKTAIFKLDTPTIYAGYLIRVRCILVNPDFLNFVMNSSYHREWCNQVKSDAVNQSNINAQKLSNLQIPIPPLAEQHRIVEEIESWFALIELIEQGKADLQTVIKQAKSKILDLAIHGKLVPQDPNDEPASELLKRINPNAEITCDNGHYENLLFEVPQNWSWSTLCEITDFIRNGAQIKQVKGATGIPITRIETISNSELDLTRMGYSDIFNEDEYSNYYLQDGDILMSHINSRTHVGKCALCRNIPYKIIHGMNLLRICLKKEILPEYISLFFRTNIFYTQIEPYIKNAVNQASINITNLRKTLIPIPPLAEQKRIVDSVNKTFAKLDAIMDSL